MEYFAATAPAETEEAKLEVVDERELLDAMKSAEEAGMGADQAVAASEYAYERHTQGRHPGEKPAAEEDCELYSDEWDIPEAREPGR